MLNKIINKILTEISFYTQDYLLPPCYVAINLTFKCNFRCQSCDIWKIKPTKADFCRWPKIISKLKNNLPASTQIEITGGEPLLEKKLLLEIIRKLKRHFKQVLINTNGSLLNHSTLSELEKTGLDIIKISFYSRQREIYNQMRGAEFAFDNALRAIKLVSNSKIKLWVAILITKQNIDGAPKLIRALKKKYKAEVIIQPLDEIIKVEETKKHSQNFLPMNLWPAKKEIEKFFNWALANQSCFRNSAGHLLALKDYYLNPSSALKYNCYSGQRNLIINPDGGISLCFKYKSFANILKDDLVGALTLKGRSQRLAIKNCKKYCRVLGCNYSRSISSLIKLGLGD